MGLFEVVTRPFRGIGATKSRTGDQSTDADTQSGDDDAIGTDHETHPAGTFTYCCQACETQFTEPRTRMVRIRCPECRSANIRAIG